MPVNSLKLPSYSQLLPQYLGTTVFYSCHFSFLERHINRIIQYGVFFFFFFGVFFKIMIKYTKHKVYNSVTLSTFTMLCNHHHYLVPEEHFHHPQKEIPYPLSSHSPFPSSPAPDNHQTTQSTFCLYR